MVPSFEKKDLSKIGPIQLLASVQNTIEVTTFCGYSETVWIEQAT